MKGKKLWWKKAMEKAILNHFSLINIAHCFQYDLYWTVKHTEGNVAELQLFVALTQTGFMYV